MYLRPLVALAAAVTLAAGSAPAVGIGTDGPDRLTGTPADDSLYGLGGADRLTAGRGNDDLDGGTGSDDLKGGAGDDAVSYASATAGVTVTLDGRANDGTPGEGDNVHVDVEDVYGSPWPDVLTGDRAANTLDGGDGPDSLQGGGGQDYLYGGPGDDILDARDGAADFVDCGAGRDAAIVDDFDAVSGCEAVGSSRRVFADVSYEWVASGPGVQLDRFRISGLYPITATIRVSCRGGGCPLRSKRYRPRSQSLDLSGLFAGRPLLPGARIEIRVTARAAIGRFLAYTVASGALHRSASRCLEPRRALPVACPR